MSNSKRYSQRSVVDKHKTLTLNFEQLGQPEDFLTVSSSAIHGRGVFSKSIIRKDDMIAEYLGERISRQTADDREFKYLEEGSENSYLFKLDENTVVDPTKKDYITKFINHSCTPNCISKIIRIHKVKRIVFFARQDIIPGDELTFDYKFERELDARERLPCLCGTKTCKGFLN